MIASIGMNFVYAGYTINRFDGKMCIRDRIELYIPKYFFAHAASLHQAFAHCAIFPLSLIHI